MTYSLIKAFSKFLTFKAEFLSNISIKVRIKNYYHHFITILLQIQHSNTEFSKNYLFTFN